MIEDLKYGYFTVFCFLYSNSEYIILVHIIMIGDLL
jgi:hypothetical protein